MTDEEFHQAIEAAKRDWPTLTDFGLGTFHHPDSDQGEDFEEERQNLGADRRRFELAVSFIQHRGLRKTIDRGVSSYGLKHTATDWHDAQTPGNNYMTNGVFIAALHYCGAQIKRKPAKHGPCPNVLTNLRQPARPKRRWR